MYMYTYMYMYAVYRNNIMVKVLWSSLYLVCIITYVSPVRE